MVVKKMTGISVLSFLLLPLVRSASPSEKGNRSETLSALESNPSLKEPWDFQSTYWKAECLALIGEKEMALDCLELDVNLGMSNYPLMSELDPFLANVRGEERFKRLMERVKYEWEHLED